MKDEYIITVKKSVKGGWRAAILTSQYGAKVKDAWAENPREALKLLAEKIHVKKIE